MIRKDALCVVVVNGKLRSGIVVKVDEKRATVELTDGKRKSFSINSVAVTVAHNALKTASRIREKEMGVLL